MTLIELVESNKNSLRKGDWEKIDHITNYLFKVNSEIIQQNTIFIITPYNLKYLNRITNDSVVGFLADEQTKDLLPSLSHPLLIVENTHQFMRSAIQYITKNKLTICITGSGGKTTTMYNLSKCLIEKGYKVQHNFRNFNTGIQLCCSILSSCKNTNIHIYEIGIAKTGDMESIVQDIINPYIAICLNISYSHDGNFPSYDHLIREKLSIFQHYNTKYAVLPTIYIDRVKIMYPHVYPIAIESFYKPGGTNEDLLCNEDLYMDFINKIGDFVSDIYNKNFYNEN